MLAELVWNAFFTASLLMGQPKDLPENIPRYEAIGYQQGEAIAGGIPVKALYEIKDKKIYIVFTNSTGIPYTDVQLFLTLTHEMVHHIQNSQGKLYLREERPEVGREKYCEDVFQSEMEALDVEDQLRELYGRRKADRFGYYVQRGFCLHPDGGM